MWNLLNSSLTHAVPSEYSKFILIFVSLSEIMIQTSTNFAHYVYFFNEKLKIFEFWKVSGLTFVLLICYYYLFLDDFDIELEDTHTNMYVYNFNDFRTLCNCTLISNWPCFPSW